MLLHRHTRDLALRLAQHEMGHYVVSRLLGFETGDVDLVMLGHFEGHRGGAATKLPQRLSQVPAIADYLERRIQVLFAGAQAETLQPHKAGGDRVDQEKAVEIIRNPKGGAEQDQAKARELIHVLRSIQASETDPLDEAKVQSELDSIDLDLWERTRWLVEDHADTILGLAQNLASRVTDIGTKAILKAAELEALPAVAALEGRRWPSG